MHFRLDTPSVELGLLEGADEVDKRSALFARQKLLKLNHRLLLKQERPTPAAGL